ncbi:MAG TPA: hypothetical protein VNN73_19790 [Blastocatellia bacterium]|nr:hypothetical protein [Blastocatellia bacterium]
MKIRANERQQISDIVREELDRANHRINERLSQYECNPAVSKEDELDRVRRFYMELANNDWTEDDEEALSAYSNYSEAELKDMMREAFRRSRIYPLPSFASLMNALRKTNGHIEGAGPLTNPDAVSAAERERIANLLHRELEDAAREIASRLKLGDTKAEIVREQLEEVEGAIISCFTPLV